MKTRVFITVKTYPTLSSAYDELVCTAGFREDGRWIRIYPIPLKLFPENPFKAVRKLPYKFFYRFEDCSKKESKLMIEDWEIGQLFWNCLRRHRGNEEKACLDVRKKYLNDFAKTKDLHFYLGTTREFHFMAPNPFIIIGVFYPKL